MNKTAIKIIKREDAEKRANAKTRISQKAESAAALSEKKFERSLHRKMTDTVSSWIAERRKNKRAEETSALRQLFGDEFLSGRLA